MKRILKWVFRLFLLAVVLLVILLLSLDPIFRYIAERNILEQTGMRATIGTFHVGLLRPVIYIKDLTLYNPKGFGNGPLMSIPEVYVEYDKPALTQGSIHITTARFNLGELDIVKNEQGETNIFSLGMAVPSKDDLKKNRGMDEFKKRTGLNFSGVDSLGISVGTFKYIDLKDPRNNRTQEINIQNTAVPNIKTEADLVGIVVLVGLRSDNFFDFLIPSGSGGALKQLGF